MVAIVIKIDTKLDWAIFDFQGFQTVTGHLGFNVTITIESYKMFYSKVAK